MTARPQVAVVIGASAGAIQALSHILPVLPPTFGAPILVVIHVPAGRSELVPVFQARCQIAVKEAEDKEPIEPGSVYFAPPAYHLLVEADGRIALSVDEPVNYSRPSIDVLFESAADAYGTGLTAIVLTGANEDGAQGLAAVVREGGHAIVQDPAEAFASTMPSAALARCTAARALSLDAIASLLLTLDTRP
jgi:two-component system chemotaxis response regulator CheB